MQLSEYFSRLKGKKVTVLGIGVSNLPLIEKLRQFDIDVCACDKRTKQQLGETARKLEAMGAILKLGEDYLEDISGDVIFRTPGMRPDLPQIQKAVDNGAELTSEMEAFFEVCPCPVIAVTGSDGKTTTTTIISKLLETEGKKVWVGGNIGTPLLCSADKMLPSDIAVLELSSFQLMTMKKSPWRAVITNLAPNHLDMHKSMDEYVRAKENIYLHQDAASLLVLNSDNEITSSFAVKAQGKVSLFSRRTVPQNGVYAENGEIYTVENGVPVHLMSQSDIFIPGMHNVENYMAAIAVTKGIVSNESILKVARSFAGVEHRIEFVRKLEGVSYYNDSIASSPSRTIAGLRSFNQKLILIAGGYDKHIPFDPLGPEVCSKVKCLLLCGDTAEKIKKAVEACSEYEPEKTKIIMCGELDKAVEKAHQIAEPGDIVTMSPACASFDRFKNFAERGEYFKKLVGELQ